MRTGPESELLSAAAAGCLEARGRLLACYRERLKRVIRARLDPRLSARVDSSDVVQEVLADAAGEMEEYLRTRDRDFYFWVRGIAERRVIDLHRRHIHAAKRSVRRESAPAVPASGPRARTQAWLADGQASPSQQVVRAEEVAALRAGLERLSEDDREVIVLRYIEQLSMPEIATQLHISLPAAKSRHLRAVQRLTEVVKEALEGSD